MDSLKIKKPKNKAIIPFITRLRVVSLTFSIVLLIIIVFMFGFISSNYTKQLQDAEQAATNIKKGISTIDDEVGKTNNLIGDLRRSIE